MNKIILTLGTATYAIKAGKLLQRAKIRSQLVKVNEAESEFGCSHGIEIDGDDFYSAISVLRNNGINYSLYRGG